VNLFAGPPDTLSEKHGIDIVPVQPVKFPSNEDISLICFKHPAGFLKTITFDFPAGLLVFEFSDDSQPSLANVGSFLHYLAIKAVKFCLAGRRNASIEDCTLLRGHRKRLSLLQRQRLIGATMIAL
jgi:hypothetical protein